MLVMRSSKEPLEKAKPEKGKQKQANARAYSGKALSPGRLDRRRNSRLAIKVGVNVLFVRERVRCVVFGSSSRKGAIFNRKAPHDCLCMNL